MLDNRFASEEFYRWLRTTYVVPLPNGSRGKLEGYFRTQLAFIDAWLKHKPDSVAARIVKDETYLDYGWDARGGGLAKEVPAEAWQPFKETAWKPPISRWTRPPGSNPATSASIPPCSRSEPA